ncbi:hypothetical protein BFP97_11660 [Roseivirga sp. 4D4]|uniref:DinB family protein n=1 Tax=Roseivirga sp. 4D4 TaxID=1889784 RepID=UPI000852EA64|nr:DinB family protein [Roseivirga sp. 4D4]OEK02138.1 hypothetical protein BFP97_11660 [Roseivirga sp. 4D4]
MNRAEIIGKLEEVYGRLSDFLLDLSQDEYEYAPEGKWNAGQQAEHLSKSVRAVTTGLTVPKLMIGYKFGKANRPSLEYRELVEKYQNKLSDYDGPAPSAYSPGKVKFVNAQKNVKNLQDAIQAMIKRLDGWSGSDMDKYIFPHPLMGKITVREMLYFTIYHAEHHHGLIRRYLKGV